MCRPILQLHAGAPTHNSIFYVYTITSLRVILAHHRMCTQGHCASARNMQIHQACICDWIRVAFFSPTKCPVIYADCSLRLTAVRIGRDDVDCDMQRVASVALVVLDYIFGDQR